MPTQSFTCPNCGAPLEYHDGDPATIRCPFCSTSVIVPQELRHRQAPQVEVSIPPEVFTQSASTRRSSCLIPGIIAAVVLIIAASVLIPIIATQTITSSVDSMTNQISTQAFGVVTAVMATEVPPPTRVPPSPTPSFANAGVTFGKQGIGQGMLDNARNIAVDGNGVLYVADYEGGRVQAFDSTGKFLYQWKVGNSKSIIEGLAATIKGEVFVACDGYIYGVEGATGKQLSRWSDNNGGEFGSLAITPDGNLAAAWYEGRWGMITTLEGHRDDLVVFNPQGKVVLRIESVISNQTGDLALDNYLAVDGKGVFYVLSDAVIYKFSAEGKFINSFGSAGQERDQFQSPGTIAVDGLGRVFVGDYERVLVFSPDGRFVDSFHTTASEGNMVFDLKGALWIVAGDKVSQYLMIEN